MLFSTSSRTKPNALRRSSPGFGKCSTSAVANGLFLESPSDAVEPALAANAIIVLGVVGSTLAQAASDRARGHRALHRLRERVVAAGIQDDKPQLLGRLDREQRAIDRNGLIENVAIGLQRRVGRDEIVGAPSTSMPWPA